MNRRELLGWLSAGACGGSTQLFSNESSMPLLWGQPQPAALRGLPPLKITDVQTILTAPEGIRLVVVKVMTSEPGLYGLGCATFTQRAYVVQTAVEKYLKPFLIGRNPDQIEDIWQSSYVSSYWRNGPVLFNAMSGVDMALWDIKGKRARMPVYQLLGGKCRFAVNLYYHASGRDFQEVEDNARKAMERGYRFVRAQVDIPGKTTYGAGSGESYTEDVEREGPDKPKYIWESTPYVRTIPKLFEHLRVKFGDEIELLHDIHERIPLDQAITLCKELEKYHLYFVEDPLPPEEIDHFRLLRQQTSTPLAMGELFNTRHEYVPLISNRLIDFIRIHLSQVGGLSMARKVAALAEFFGVRTAWHDPGDASPVGHAAALALELATYNCGVHENHDFSPVTREVFPGCPEIKNGYLYATEAHGFGIDINEKLAAKFPFPDQPNFDYHWGVIRKLDGTIVRP
jgi:mannonate dehydratase